MIHPINRIREIDTHAPIIYGSNSTGIRKLAKGLTVTDNTRHKKGMKMATYAKELKRVITLDSMSDHLRLYD